MDPAIKSSACSRSGASAVQAQAQALCDQALRQAHALRDQRHGAFPEVPSSAWFPGSPAPRGAKLAGSTLDQAPVAKAAVLRHDFHFVRGGASPAKSISASLAAAPWGPTAERPPRALTGESGGSGIMLSAQLLLRLRRRVGRALLSKIRLDALALLLAKSLCGARCSSVKQVGSAVQRAAV